MLSWLSLYLVGWTTVLVVGMLLVSHAMWALVRVLTGVLQTLRGLRVDVGRMIDVLEKSASQPATSGIYPVARSDSHADAPAQPAPFSRETFVPLLAPQDIAPSLKRPPRPSGGFGNKVSE